MIPTLTADDASVAEQARVADGNGERPPPGSASPRSFPARPGPLRDIPSKNSGISPAVEVGYGSENALSEGSRDAPKAPRFNDDFLELNATYLRYVAQMAALDPELVAKLPKLDLEKDTHEDCLEKYSATIDALQTDLALIQLGSSDKAGMQSKISQLRIAIQALQTDRETYQKELDRMTTPSAGSDARRQDRQMRWDAVKRKERWLKKRMAELKQRSTDLRSEIDELKKQVNADSVELEPLEKRVKRLTAHRDGLKTQVAVFQHQLARTSERTLNLVEENQLLDEMINREKSALAGGLPRASGSAGELLDQYAKRVSDLNKELARKVARQESNVEKSAANELLEKELGPERSEFDRQKKDSVINIINLETDYLAKRDGLIPLSREKRQVYDEIADLDDEKDALPDWAARIRGAKERIELNDRHIAELEAWHRSVSGQPSQAD